MEYTTSTLCHEKSRTVTTHGRSGLEWSTDIPIALGGIGDMPSPPEMLAAATAACMVSYISFMATRHNIDASGLRVQAGAIEEDGIINTLAFRITVPAKLQGLRSMVEECAGTCPVKKAIAHSVHFVFEWEWQ